MEGRPAYQSAHAVCRPLRSPAIRRAGSHQRVFGNFFRRPGRGIRHHPGGKPKLEFSRDLEETGRYLMRRVPAMAAFAATRDVRGEHDPEKACPALDAGWVPIFRKDHAVTLNANAIAPTRMRLTAQVVSRLNQLR